jgi:hypothetical protein
MPDDPTKPNTPDSPAPTGCEKTTDAGASPSPPRSPWFREVGPEEYGKDYIIGGAVPPKRR